MTHMSEAQRRSIGSGYDAKRLAAIQKSTDQIKDAFEAMTKAAAEIAVLYRYATMRTMPAPGRIVAAAAIIYKALELATAPARIVTELANLESNLTNFDKANQDQQAQVREALEKIADPISAALDRLDEAFGTRDGKNWRLATDISDVREAIRDIGRDMNGDPSKVPHDVDKLRRTIQKLQEDIQKQLTETSPDEPEASPAPQRDTSDKNSDNCKEPRSSLRPDDHAPTESDPGKNWKAHGYFPIVG